MSSAVPGCAHAVHMVLAFQANFVKPLNNVLQTLGSGIMALYHVHMSWVGKGQQAGGARGFHQYLSREGIGDGVQFHRYLDTDGERGRDDLVASGHEAMPQWAESPAHFWQEADRLERAKGPVFFHLQVTLPRKLSPAAREGLADDIREVTVGRYPHSWAIHEPMARDGSGIQPHVHIQFSTRRDESDLERSAEQWFKQANGKHPERGGIAKDASWFTKGRLHDIRAAVSVMTNAALQREGVALAVDHRTLEAQGISRDPARYGSPHDQGDLDRTMAYREQLRTSGTLGYEHLQTFAGWRDQAVKLLSLDRQYVIDLCHDHVWRYDCSPARTLEREQSLQRALSLGMGDREPTITRTQERTPLRQVAHGRHALRELAAALAREDEGPQGGGLRVRIFRDREEEREQGHDRGMSW